MTDNQRPQWPEELAALLACCPSCFQLHPDEYVCSCLVTRAATLAEEAYEVRRQITPAWRRPRAWGVLPERARQDATADAMCLVDALEASGWRLVTMQHEGRHTHRPEPVDPDATPPNGSFRVPNVVA